MYYHSLYLFGKMFQLANCQFFFRIYTIYTAVFVLCSFRSCTENTTMTYSKKKKNAFEKLNKDTFNEYIDIKKK